MPEKIREFQNYGGLTLTALDKHTLEEFTLSAIPMRLFLYDGVLKLTVEVWNSVEDFEMGLPSDSPFSKTFELDYQEAKQEFADFFEAIEVSILLWLKVPKNQFDLEYFDINLTNLQINARARHRTREFKNVSDQTGDLNEFEQIKIDYPVLVQSYFGFAVTYFKTHDAKLAKFN